MSTGGVNLAKLLETENKPSPKESDIETPKTKLELEAIAAVAEDKQTSSSSAEKLDPNLVPDTKLDSDIDEARRDVEVKTMAEEGDFATRSEEMIEEPIFEEHSDFTVTYRHKTIPRFRTGEFQFKRGLLTITDPEKEQVFLALWSKLHFSDKREIVKMRVVQNELSPEDSIRRRESRTVRGPMGTADIRARTADTNVKQPASTF